MSSQIILYDIASKDGKGCWSPYTWKVRLSLNFLELAYETKFLEYPDIATTLKSFNIPPGDPSQGHGAAYTLPAARLNNGTYVMESMAIAHQLEAMASNPESSQTIVSIPRRAPIPPPVEAAARSLHLSDPVVDAAHKVVEQLDLALYPNFMARIAPLLNPVSAEYFERTRAEDFGMSMTQLEKDKGGEQAWQVTAERALRPMRELLAANGGGPFLLGDTVCYGDFVIVAFWQFLRRLDESLFVRLMAFDGSFSKLYDACEPWLSRKVD